MPLSGVVNEEGEKRAGLKQDRLGRDLCEGSVLVRVVSAVM